MARQAYVFLYVAPGRVESAVRALGRIQQVRGVEATDTRVVVES